MMILEFNLKPAGLKPLFESSFVN